MTIPQYFPFTHGVYDVKAGITALGKDHGNGALDSQVFQIDEQFECYRAAKQLARSNARRHILQDDLSAGAQMTIEGWIMNRLNAEHPGHFRARPFDGGLDGMAMFIQDDMAVLVIDDDGTNRLAYLNVCMPSGWAPEDKIGKPFDQVHAPVPHIEPLNAKHHSIAKLMVNATKGAVRFAWTVTDDAALNHHPKRDRTLDHPTPLPDHNKGEPLLRVERQVIWGFPEHSAALFLIRTYLYPFDELDTPTRLALRSAVNGMSEASLAYKSMDRAIIVDQLDRI